MAVPELRASTVRCRVLVDRDRETAELLSLVERARGGHGGLSVLAGEAGAGKSRLARLATALAIARGMTVLTGRSVPGPTPVPYRPFTEALAPLFRADRADADQLTVYRGRLGRLLPDWRGGAPDPAVEVRESPIMLAESARELLQAIAGSVGCLVVLEDLHWGDVESLEIVDHLADTLGDVPVLVLVTARPEGLLVERLARWRRHPEVAVMPVGPLSDTGVRRAVASCLETDSPPAEVVRCVQANSDGNPFLVEELLAGLITAGCLVRDASRWRVTGEVRPSLPFDFAASLQPRLAALGAQAQMVLGAAALFGRRFHWELLPAVTGVERAGVIDALRGAVAEQLIDVDGDEFRFRHALTREAVLQSTLPPERRLLADRAWRAVELAHPDLPGPWCELAADLAEVAGRRDAAAVCLLESARRAASRGALASAEAVVRRARALALASDGRAALLDAVDRLLVDVLVLAGKPGLALEVGEALLHRLTADVSNRSPVRLEVLLVLARAAVHGGDIDRAARLLADAEQLAAGGPPGRSMRSGMDALNALVALESGRRDDAAALAGAAVEAAARGGDVVAECEARLVLGRVLRNASNDDAIEQFDHAARTAAAHGHTAWELRARQERALLRAYVDGDLRELHEVRKLAAGAGAVVTVAVMDLAAGELGLARWDARAAIDHGRRCVAASLRFGLATGPVASLWEAGGHALAGDEQAMEAAVAQALAPDPGDPRILGDLWGKVYALRAMVIDDRDSLRHDLDEMMRWARAAPPTTSVFESRFVWAALHAVEDDDGGRAARAELASATHLNGWPAFRGALAAVDAVVAGRCGDRDLATRLMAESDRRGDGHADYTSARYSRILVAEAAIRDGWGDPITWLRESEAYFATRGYDHVARRCRLLLGRAGAPVPRPGRGHTPVPEHLRALGVTSRELDVLRLVAEHLTNREIAARLHLSPKTVERHLTNLFARTGAKRRADLADLLTEGAQA